MTTEKRTAGWAASVAAGGALAMTVVGLAGGPVAAAGPAPAPPGIGVRAIRGTRPGATSWTGTGINATIGNTPVAPPARRAGALGTAAGVGTAPATATGLGARGANDVESDRRR